MERRGADVRFGSFATVLGWPADVCFAPNSYQKADMPGGPFSANRNQPHHFAPQKKALLFDHLVGGEEQVRRHFNAERLGGLAVDHQLELA